MPVRTYTYKYTYKHTHNVGSLVAMHDLFAPVTGLMFILQGVQ